MFSTRVQTKLCSPKQVALLGRVAAPRAIHPSLLGYPAGLRTAWAATQHGQLPRSFSTTTVSRLRDVFPSQETHFIQKTPPAWPHPGWTEEQLRSVTVGHREPKTVSDWVAWKMVRLARWCMDLATGIRPEQKVDKNNPTTAIIANKPLTEAQWLVRCVFLESIAGGMPPFMYCPSQL
jgi:Alternative oxidase